MKISDLFFKKTGKKYLYNIQSIENVSSIIQYGLLSNQEAKKIKHLSIAMKEIQERRDLVTVPNGLSLHQYANLYFDYWNPMLSKRREINERICIIVFNREVMDIDGVVFSDRNASSSYASFYSPHEGLVYLDFHKIYAKYWNDDHYYTQFEKKAKKCAEVLVPKQVPSKYILGIVVYSESAKLELINQGYHGKIAVKPEWFF